MITRLIGLLGFWFSTTVMAGGTAIMTELNIDMPNTGDMFNPETAEFVEFYDTGVGNESLNGYVIVFYSATNNVVYQRFDLDGLTTDSNGFFVIGDFDVPGMPMGPAPGALPLPGFNIENNAGAVAIYSGNDTDFPVNQAVTATNLIDAVVYDNGNGASTATLVSVLTPGQTPPSEGDADNATSLAKVPEAYPVLVLERFVALPPTPFALNSPPPPSPTANPLAGSIDVTFSSSYLAAIASDSVGVRAFGTATAINHSDGSITISMPITNGSNDLLQAVGAGIDFYDTDPVGIWEPCFIPIDPLFDSSTGAIYANVQLENGTQVYDGFQSTSAPLFVANSPLRATGILQDIATSNTTLAMLDVGEVGTLTSTSSSVPSVSVPIPLWALMTGGFVLFIVFNRTQNNSKKSRR